MPHPGQEKLTETQIVILEENQDVRRLVSDYLSGKGYEVICYSDPRVVIEKAKEKDRRWSLLLSDFRFSGHLPGDYKEEVKRSLPDVPVLSLDSKNFWDLKGKGNGSSADLVYQDGHLVRLLQTVRRVTRPRRTRSPHIIGQSPSFLRSLDLARRVAGCQSNIFITGESGTGKEIFARFIHQQGPRQNGPFIAVNCSAIPENLIESEFFGHAKGSFTGAFEKKIGLFEEAQDGTLFLDEVGDLSLPLQAKLLRVLQEKKVRRVGENTFRSVNCRIISATHKDLFHEIREGHFREDLFFRLNVIPIRIPPLRERKEDILLLAESFLRKFAHQNDSPALFFSKEMIKSFLENQWRGNIRELENLVERSVVLCDQEEVDLVEDLPFVIPLEHLEPVNGAAPLDLGRFCIDCSLKMLPLNEVLHRYILFAVSLRHGARDLTAKELGIDRKTLYKHLKEIGRTEIH